MAIVRADDTGVIRGKIRVPVGVPVGTKSVVFEGAETGRASTQYIAAGETVVDVRSMVTVHSRPGTDPLAQTFVLAADRQIGGVDLQFTALGPTNVKIQIRETATGLPTQTVLAEAIVPTSSLSTDGPSRIQFRAPVTLRGGTEYALVALCDDSVSSLAIAELGKRDAGRDAWVTSQPYQVGVLLSSSNASTWTPHQDRDLCFTLLACRFTSPARRIELGAIPVTDATDLMLLASADIPAATARVEYSITLPSGEVVRAAPGQPVRLAAPATGALRIAADLYGTAEASPLLMPGTQLVHGKVGGDAVYISRAMPAGAGVKVRVLIDAELPPGASVIAAMKGIDAGDVWAAMPLVATRPIDGGHELAFELTGVNESAVHVRLTAAGTHAARPVLRNFRMMAL